GEMLPSPVSWNVSGLVRAGKIILDASGTTPGTIGLNVPTGRIEGLLVITPRSGLVSTNVGEGAYVGGMEFADGPDVLKISQVRSGLSVIQGEMLVSSDGEQTRIVGGTINGIITGTIATERAVLGIDSSLGPAAALGDLTVSAAMLLHFSQGDLRLLKD